MEKLTKEEISLIFWEAKAAVKKIEKGMEKMEGIEYAGTKKIRNQWYSIIGKMNLFHEHECEVEMSGYEEEM